MTNSDDAGPGTLRQAIADSVSGDTIVIALDQTNTIALTNGPLLITNDLTIVASNAAVAIDAGGSSRVFEIASNTVVLDSLIITNGNVPDNGGGILVDDGATLTLTNCTVTGNIAGAGGGIFLSGNNTVAIYNCIFSTNSATNSGGAIDNETNGTLTINGSVFTANSASRGGAIFNNFGTNLLDQCTFSGNSAEDGGAIANFDSVLTASGLSVSNNSAAAGGGIFNGNINGLLILSNSTLSGNFATNFGGGINNTNGGIATINNCTISENACPTDQGGGVDNWSTITVNNCTISGSPSGGGFLNNGGVAVCNNSTFSGNFALFDGGGYYAYFGTNILNNCTISGNSAKRRAGGIYEYNSSSVLNNTIVAGNSAIIASPDLLGSISGAKNLISVDPRLSPLGDYGGPTQTMPPLSGSPAINAGLDSITSFLTTDQRGYPRLASAHVDIGAVEVQPVLVTNTNDDGPGSLRAVASIEPAFILFTNTLSGQTILLTSGQVTLSNSVDIDASSLAGGIVIDAGGASRVFEISTSTVVTLDSLTITNGNVSGNGGGILMDDGVTLTLNNCTVAGNSAAMGGGVAQISGFLTANNSTVSGNTATQNGGGLAIAGGLATLNNCTLVGNSGMDGGGLAVGAGAADTLNNCTITGNSASDGGGIAQDLLSVSLLVNTVVAGNTATSDVDIFGPLIGTNNFISGDPLLAPLGNYGGRTQTMPPRAGSAVIDAGLDSVSLITDQRGFPRLSGAHVDIGAVEAQLAPANNRPVLKLGGKPSLGTLNIAFTNIPDADFTLLSTTNPALPLNKWDDLGRPIAESSRLLSIHRRGRDQL